MFLFVESGHLQRGLPAAVLLQYFVPLLGNRTITTQIWLSRRKYGRRGYARMVGHSQLKVAVNQKCQAKLSAVMAHNSLKKG